jgi:hypothetical protein
MKTLSGTSKLVVLTAITALTVLSFRSFAQPEGNKPPPADQTITLKFKGAKVQNETNFQKALCKLHSNQYQVHMKHSDAGKADEDWPPCPASSDIKTDKITTSAFAMNLSADELTVIGPHVTQAVSSANKADIQKILNELQ